MQCQLRAGLMVTLYRKALVTKSGSTGSTTTSSTGSTDRMRARAVKGGAGKAGGRGSKQSTAAADTAAVAAPPVADVSTLMSVDAGRVINLGISLHELWSLPAQIIIALYLLYLQVCCTTVLLGCTA